MRKIYGSLILISFVALSLYAQQTNVGGIAGIIRDPSGGPIPGAQVAVVNQSTHLTQEAKSEPNGTYSFTLLPNGMYTVTVTAPGFQKVERADIPVIGGQTITADLQLVLGLVTQTVKVTSAAPTVDTTTVNMGTTRTVQEISELPVGISNLGSREAAGFIKTLAGVALSPSYITVFDWAQVSRGSINGIQPGEFGYQIDGLDAGCGEAESAEDFIAPSPDDVSETRVTDNTDASIGFNGGVAYTLTLKSGTNALHGGFYWYGANDVFNARNWFGATVQRVRENEPGFTVGGPVYIPHVYDGRNKTFFFTSIDTYRQVTAATIVATIPTVLMRGGNFTEVLGAQVGTDDLGRPVYANEIYDPATTRTVTAGQQDTMTGLTAVATGPVRDPFNYGGMLNVINPAQLSRVSKFFQAGYELPTLPGVVNNWAGPALPYSDVYKDKWLLKVDQKINEQQRVTFGLEKDVPWFLGSAKGTQAGLSGYSLSSNSSGFLLPVDSTTFASDLDSYRLRFNYVWTMRSDMLFNLKMGETRNPHRVTSQLPLTGPERDADTAAGFTGTLNPMTPWTMISGYDNVGGFGPRFGPGSLIDSQRTVFGVNWTWVKSAHQIEVGSDLEVLPFIFHNDENTMGTVSFGTSDTGLPGFTAASTGWSWASFLLGAVNNTVVNAEAVNKFTSGGFALYAQDKWRVTRKLTLNYGLRWEFYLPGHERYNQLTYFDPTRPNPGAGGLLGALNFYGVGPGRNGLTQIIPNYYKAFAPKLGFAYAWNPKTVVRASFGLAYFPDWTKWIGSNGMTVSQQGFFSQAVANETASGGLFPAYYWDNGFPGVFPPSPDLDPAQANGQSPLAINRTQTEPPMTVNIGVEVERALPKQFILRVGYVGTMSHHTPINSYNFNVIPLSDISLGNLLFADINSAQAQAAGIKVPYPGFSGTVAQALLPFPQYGALQTQDDEYGNSTYNALQVNLQKHFGNLTMLANWTASKMLTNGTYPGYYGYGSATSVQYPSFRNSEGKELSYLDYPTLVNISWVYQLPFGKGQHFASHVNGAFDRLVGGWRLSAIQVYRAGLPLDVTGNTSIPGVGSTWVNEVPGVPVRTSTRCSNLNPYGSNNTLLNVNAFSEPAPFQFGNTYTLPNVRGCGYGDEDVSIDKTIAITERARFRIGFIFANLFNRHYWTGVNTSIASPGFGTISGAMPPRTGQFYGRFDF